MADIKRVGILTGGGDCPGLNPVIRGVVRKGIEFYKYEMIGILYGWKGLLEKITKPLSQWDISGILPRGGTILGTSRTNPAKIEGGYEKARQNFAELGLDAVIAVGGEDTLGVANKLTQMNCPVIGVPKTIDNDLSATDFTFGFDTCVNIVMEAIDRLHTTAESHDRVMVVEVMGRHAGWIAVYGGIAGGADYILIPEEKFDLTRVCEHIKKRHANGKNFSIVVVSEGALPKDVSEFITQDQSLDAFGHIKLGGIGEKLAKQIEKKTGYETRYVVLGHLQRGGSPTAFDRVLGTRFGVAAIDLVAKGQFGKMVSLQGNKIVSVNLSDAVAKLKTVDLDLYDIAKVFFG